MRASTASPIANQRVLHLEPVAPLHFIARERAQRFANEVAVGHFDDGVGILLGDRDRETVVLNRSMKSGTRASSTRHTVCTRNAIFRLSLLSTASSPVKSSV